MTTRAPDNQPTSNLRGMVDNERAKLIFWEQAQIQAKIALRSATYRVGSSKTALSGLEWQLETREREERENRERGTGEGPHAPA